MFTQLKDANPTGAGGWAMVMSLLWVKCGWPDPCCYVLGKLAWAELLPETVHIGLIYGVNYWANFPPV